MSNPSTFPHRPPKWLLVFAVIAIVFGVMTVISGGGVLFGPRAAQTAAGYYLPYVVWFNFLAGFAYVLAGVGIWVGARWAKLLSMFILVTTMAIAVVFGVHVASGGEYESRTVGALVFRIAVWAVIVMALRPAGRRT
jgi:hypothetical protein